MEVTIVYIQGKATENHIEIPKTTNMKYWAPYIWYE